MIEFLAAAMGFLGDRPFGLAGGTDKVFRDAIDARFLCANASFTGRRYVLRYRV